MARRASNQATQRGGCKTRGLFHPPLCPALPALHTCPRKGGKARTRHPPGRLLWLSQGCPVLACPLLDTAATTRPEANESIQRQEGTKDSLRAWTCPDNLPGEMGAQGDCGSLSHHTADASCTPPLRVLGCPGAGCAGGGCHQRRWHQAKAWGARGMGRGIVSPRLPGCREEGRCEERQGAGDGRACPPGRGSCCRRRAPTSFSRTKAGAGGGSGPGRVPGQ